MTQELSGFGQDAWLMEGPINVSSTTRVRLVPIGVRSSRSATQGTAAHQPEQPLPDEEHASAGSFKVHQHEQAGVLARAFEP